jgi:GxxExxY protein
MSHEKENHDGHDGHDEGRFRMRLVSPLSTEVEAVMTQVIDCAMDVHKALGPGFLESIYRKAMGVALKKARLSFECEKAISVLYDGVELTGQRVDLVVAGAVVVELKAVVRFDEIHQAQVISYLKTMGLRAGLLINFHAPLLHRGLKRIVL